MSMVDVGIDLREVHGVEQLAALHLEDEIAHGLQVLLAQGPAIVDVGLECDLVRRFRSHGAAANWLRKLPMMPFWKRRPRSSCSATRVASSWARRMTCSSPEERRNQRLAPRFSSQSTVAG